VPERENTTIVGAGPNRDADGKKSVRICGPAALPNATKAERL
jgi:hypothetical protein